MGEAGRIVIGRNDAQDQSIAFANGNAPKDQIFCGLSAQEATQTGMPHQLFNRLLNKIRFQMKQSPLLRIL